MTACAASLEVRTGCFVESIRHAVSSWPFRGIILSDERYGSRGRREQSSTSKTTTRRLVVHPMVPRNRGMFDVEVSSVAIVTNALTLCSSGIVSPVSSEQLYNLLGKLLGQVVPSPEPFPVRDDRDAHGWISESVFQ